MEIGSVLFILAILVLAGGYVARPLREPAVSAGVGPAHPQLSRLQARRERLLDAIRELDADHSMGKVLPDEYQRHRRQLTMQGAAVLRQLDQLTGGPPADSLEAELEARVARLKQGLGSQSRTAAAERQARAPDHGQAVDGAQARPAEHCPTCGAGVQADDRFCSDCGSALREQRV